MVKHRGERPGDVGRMRQDVSEGHHVQAALLVASLRVHHQPGQPPVRKHHSGPRHATPSGLGPGCRSPDVKGYPAPGEAAARR